MLALQLIGPTWVHVASAVYRPARVEVTSASSVNRMLGLPAMVNAVPAGMVADAFRFSTICLDPANREGLAPLRFVPVKAQRASCRKSSTASGLIPL